MKNWTIVTAVIFAIITATAAVIFRPIRTTGEISYATEQTTSQTSASHTQVSETVKIKETTTKREEKSTTEQVKLTETTENLTTKSSLISKFKEFAEKDRKWLKSKETDSKTEGFEMTPQDFRRAGVIYYNGYKFTYYSEKVLPGKGLRIPGRHSDGNFVRDGEGYIVLASQDLPKGTVVQTPFGPGKVYDVCGQSGVIDIYCSW